MSDITQLLKMMGSGDIAAEDKLLGIVYDELKRIAAAKLSYERPGHTLQTTAPVNEAYLRLVGKHPIQPETSQPQTMKTRVRELGQTRYDGIAGAFFRFCGRSDAPYFDRQCPPQETVLTWWR